MTLGGGSRPSELVSLAKRIGFLQVLRAGMAGVVMTSSLVAPGVVGAGTWELAPATLVYGLLIFGAELLRRAGPRRIATVGWMLLVDGLYLAWAVHVSGGPLSSLRFLVYIHIVAVSLLASYRTGLKIALWHSLLLVVTYYAEAAGFVTAAGLARSEFPGLSAFNVTAMWLFAIVTATFSSINERELRRRRTDLESLAKLAADLETVSTPAEVGQVLARHLMGTFGFRRALVFGRRRGELFVLGRAPEGDVEEDPVGHDQLLEEAEVQRTTVLVRRLDSRSARVLSRLLPDAHNVVVAPMVADGLAIGAVALERGPSTAGKIERRLVSSVEQFAAHAALALRNAWLLERVQQLAETDPLTGVYNRRTFGRQLERHLSHAERHDESLTLALFDLDHFKRFNDRFGHQVGDEILRQAAQALVTASRSFDTVARYGGEEFAVILPGLRSAEALGAVERLRAAVSEIDAPAPVTASAGVATYPVHARDGGSLLRSADEALYESKERGRDRSTRSRRRGGLRPLPDRHRPTDRRPAAR